MSAQPVDWTRIAYQRQITAQQNKLRHGAGSQMDLQNAQQALRTYDENRRIGAGYKPPTARALQSKTVPATGSAAKQQPGIWQQWTGWFNKMPMWQRMLLLGVGGLGLGSLFGGGGYGYGYGYQPYQRNYSALLGIGLPLAYAGYKLYQNPNLWNQWLGGKR